MLAQAPPGVYNNHDGQPSYAICCGWLQPSRDADMALDLVSLTIFAAPAILRTQKPT